MASMVDEALLSTGVAFHTGGCDKSGHPVVIFPTLHHTALSEISDSELVSLIQYIKSLVPTQHKLNGFSYLINLHKASQQIITKLSTALHTIQLSSNPPLVHCLYVIKPKASKNLALLEKLTGLKPSKKSAVKKMYQVHVLKDFASLHRHVDKISLTDEFGGHQQVNISAWVQFRLQVDGVLSEITRCQTSLDQSKDEMQILCEIEIPAPPPGNTPDTDNTTQPLLDTINAKYHNMMRGLKLEHVIDQCGTVLEELNTSRGPVKYAQGDLLRETVKSIRLGQRELTEAREHLQLQWRQAQARVVQAQQLRGHQKKANKITKWIERNGLITLSELSVSVTSTDQIKLLSHRLKELCADFEELQKECDYIQTDVEYMALQDLSEFTESLKSIERMKKQLNEFDDKLVDLNEKFNSTSAVFSNVAKCYNWYCDFVNSVQPAQNQTQFTEQCVKCLERLRATAPPKEWLEYIETRLTLIDNAAFCSSSATLLQRIRTIFTLSSSGQKEQEITPEVMDMWRVSLEQGFDSLPAREQSESLSLQNEAAPQKTQAKPNKPSSNAKRSVSSAPKLRRTPNHVPDSSTDDVESPQPRARRPVKNKKTPSKSAQHKQDEKGEVYIDLTDSVKVTKLPDSLSHIDLSKFLENEPPHNQGPVSSTPINDEHESRRTEANTNTNKKKSRKELLPEGTKTPSNKPTNQNPVSGKKKKRVARSRHDDETDDSCPYPSDHLNHSRYSLLSADSHPSQNTKHKRSPAAPQLSTAPPDIPQDYNLPYNPLTHIERLERIYTSTSPTPEQKLDMMASLIDEGDDSCFRVELRQISFVRRSTDNTTPTPSDTSESKRKKIGRLTPANLSRELSTDVSYPENIYSWLKKQNDQSFSPRGENMEDEAEVKEEVREEMNEVDSVRECIERAEKLLQEDIPTFQSTSRGLSDEPQLSEGAYNNNATLLRLGRNNDIVSKSGDSGITELTNREALLTNGHRQRFTSKESGLDSDMTGYTVTENSSNLQPRLQPDYGGARPRNVPPLRLRKSHHRSSGPSASQRLRDLDLRHEEETE